MGTESTGKMPCATGPLAGVKVIDITTVVMGPMAVQMLGDLGADVIKIEEPGGDMMRNLGLGPRSDMSGMALNLLRNRRSITVDMATPEGHKRLLQLTDQADVVITNLRPKSLANLGITGAELRKRNPALIFCQAAGYPSDSPDANRPAYDDIIQSACGIADTVSRVSGTPQIFPTIVADKVSALVISNAVTAALFHRERSDGKGQCIEVPMIDNMRWFLLQEHIAGAATEPPLSGAGYPRVLAANRKPHATLDGWIGVLPYSDRNWRDFLNESGHPELVADERFATVKGRLNNVEFVYGKLGDILRTRSTSEWVEFLDRLDIPASPVVTLDELVAGLPLEDHPHIGAYRVNTNPIRFEHTPVSVHQHAPLPGEHSELITAALAEDPQWPAA
jgi:crotonobetainyl-CoA:carnitine CoA-transferase CaiB-like acyl-CoA transferase